MAFERLSHLFSEEVGLGLRGFNTPLDFFVRADFTKLKLLVEYAVQNPNPQPQSDSASRLEHANGVVRVL